VISGVFAILISVIWMEENTKFISIPYIPSANFCRHNKASTALYCLCTAADSIVDVSFIWRWAYRSVIQKLSYPQIRLSADFRF